MFQRIGRSNRLIIRSLRRRGFCDKKAADSGPAQPPPPPPPPQNGGGGGLLPILALAGLGGGGYYFQDDIKEYFGMGTDGKDSIDNKLASPQIKEEVEVLGKKLAEQAKQEEEKEAAKLACEAAQAAAASKKTTAATTSTQSSTEIVDYDKVRTAIVDILDADGYDDGSLGPVFVRLAWHSAGTFDKNTGKGGSEGGCMRFAPESEWGANAGLDIARAKLEPIKAKFPGITYSDLWSLAGTVAIEEMGGPTMKWRPGRKDHDDSYEKLPDGLLPDADGRDKKENPGDHLRDIFYRMGFNDKEIVCLSGAHALGRCHTDRSGFWGPWTRAPTTMSNEYFRLLLEEKWSKKVTHKGGPWNGPEQYEDPSGELMMLPTDMALTWDPKFLPYVEEYAKDEEKFFQDFAKVWIKLQENGVRKFNGWRRYIFFGPRE